MKRISIIVIDSANSGVQVEAAKDQDAALNWLKDNYLNDWPNSKTVLNEIRKNDFYETDSKNPIKISLHNLCPIIGNDGSKLEYVDQECVHCNKPILKSESIVDYEGWPMHPKCLGPYDAWVFFRNKKSPKHLIGFEDEKRAHEVIQEDYPNYKSIELKLVRPQNQKKK